MQTIQEIQNNMNISIKIKLKVYKQIQSFLTMINTKIFMFKILQNKNHLNKKITHLIAQMKKVLRI